MNMKKLLIMGLVILFPMILYAELVCPLTNGCPIDNKGVCIGCVESEPKKKISIPSKTPVLSKPQVIPKPTITNKRSFHNPTVKKKIVVKKNGYLEEGQYYVDRVVNERGYELKWEKGIVLDIQNLSYDLYLMKLMGSATISNGQTMNCNPPTIYSMTIDNRGNQLSQKVLDKGNHSCPISDMKKDKWRMTYEGISKVKRGIHRKEKLTFHYIKVKEPLVISEIKNVMEKRDTRWLSSYHKKKTTSSGCTWRCVIEPCDDSMLPDGCRWVGR